MNGSLPRGPHRTAAPWLSSVDATFLADIMLVTGNKTTGENWVDRHVGPLQFYHFL